MVDLKTGNEAWKYEIGAPVRASPAVTSDWVIAGADDGVLYAFRQKGEGTQNSAVSPRE